MKTIYFLDGLGSNRYYVKRLEATLLDKGIKLHYLPLPGHPDNLDCQLSTLEELVSWFETSVLENAITLMGFSLGADFAAYLAHQSSKIKQLILLDGAYWDLSEYPIEQELQDIRNYLSSQVTADLSDAIQEQKSESFWGSDLEEAIYYSYQKKEGGYHLRLNEESILDLLRLRRKMMGTLALPSFSVPTLLLISGQPEELIKEKRLLLEKIQNPLITIKIINEASHSMYLEVPEKIAETLTF